MRNHAWNERAPERQKIAQREMQPDAEHQKDHADVGELQRQIRIGDEARCERSDGYAGDQIAGNRRKPQPVRDRSEDEREPDTRDDGGDERRRFHASVQPGFADGASGRH